MFRAALSSIPNQYLEAAKAIGLRPWQRQRYVVWPVMFRICLPALSNNFISLFKDTSLAAAIAVPGAHLLRPQDQRRHLPRDRDLAGGEHPLSRRLLRDRLPAAPGRAPLRDDPLSEQAVAEACEGRSCLRKAADVCTLAGRVKICTAAGRLRPPAPVSGGGFWQHVWVARHALLGGLVYTIELSLIVIVIGTAIGALGGVCAALRRLAAALPGARLRRHAARHPGAGADLRELLRPGAARRRHLGVLGRRRGARGVLRRATCRRPSAGALASIPDGQTEAAKAIGLRPWQRLWYVVLPQATRRILPPWVNTAVEMVKGSTLLSVIGVVELLLATQQVISRTYEVIPFYLLAGAIYLVLNFTISQLGAALERRFAYIRY